MTASKKPEKANKNWAVDNAFAQKWTEESLTELAEKVVGAAEGASSIVGIAVKCGIAYKYLTALGDRYDIVCRALDLASDQIAESAWKQGFEAKGFPNILTMAIKRHDSRQMKVENEQTKATEKIKGDEKIRTQNALIADNKDTITDMAVAAQAIQDINAKKKQEKLED